LLGLGCYAYTLALTQRKLGLFILYNL
jgi:hypothetical protein